MFLGRPNYKSIHSAGSWPRFYLAAPECKIAGETPAPRIALFRGHYRLHFLFVDVEVGGDALYVVVFFESFDQPQHLRRLGTGQLDVILRYPADFGGIRGDAFFHQRAADCFKSFGRGQNFPSRAVIAQILGAGVQNNREHFVLVGLFFGYHDLALALEHPTDGAVFGHVSAVFVHQMAELADDAVAVGSHDLDDHAHASRSVALEVHFLVLLAFQLPSAARQGAFNVVIGHIFIFGRQNGGAQTRIGIRVAAAHASGNGDFADKFREYAAALGVGGRLLMFNCSPLGMPRHGNRLVRNNFGDWSLLIATIV